MADARPDILVIDDDLSSRTFLRNHLRNEGYNIIECETGAEGLKTARTRQPVLIILAYDLPESKGKEVLLALKKQRATRDTPVLVLTTANSKKLKLQCVRDGAADCLTKPCSHEELAVRVGAHIRTTEANRLRVLIEFAGATAHELRQPLCVLGGYVDFLEMVLGSKDREDLGNVLTEMRKGVDRMTSLIERMEGMQEYRSRSYWGDTRIVDLNEVETEE